jgi:2-hydroxychromene-2-carboxylate isomerase
MNIKPKFWPFDASLADRLIIAVAASGAPVESVLPQAFAYVFEAELNLADEAVLTQLLSDARLDAAALLAHAKGDEMKAAYDANLAEAVAGGIFGCPSYVRDGEVFWGQDRIDFLEEAIVSGRPAFSVTTL